MSRIVPLLFLGSANEAQDINFLQSNKIKTIVNAAMEIPDYFPDEFEYVRLELDDTTKQSLSRVLDPVSNKIIQNMKEGRATLVHCAAGISRSSSMIIFTLMKLHQWNYDRAFKFVKSIHPRTQPNPGFVEQLVMRNTSMSRSGSIVVNKPQVQQQFVEKHHQNIETIIPDEPQTQSTHQQPSSLYKRLDSPGEGSSEKKWSQLTFDCPECDQPEYTPSRHGIYARIFS